MREGNMKRALQIFAGLLATLLLLLTLAICGGLVWRLHRQNELAPLLALGGPRAIHDEGYVTIGGVQQWISIRGEKRTNPVILFVHGGPGAALSGHAAIFRAWERDFTLVQWDQRGGGLTFAGGARLTDDVPLQRMIGDGIEVAEYVRRRLGAARLILVGHSWGSVLGVHMVKARPDLFAAYVGTGQIMDVADQMAVTYEATLRRARAAHEDADILTLEKIGRPPFSTASDRSNLLMTRNRYVSPADGQYLGLGTNSDIVTTMTSPDLSLGQAIASVHGMLVTAGSLDIYPPLAHADLRARGCDFPIPFFVIEGDDDRFTYTDLAKAYYDCIHATHKQFLAIPGGHFAMMTNADAFRRALIQNVRPLAPAAGTAVPEPAL
jgi:pimeloyl-ACP methyl ester carboxylesterase